MEDLEEGNVELEQRGGNSIGRKEAEEKCKRRRWMKWSWK